MKQPARKWNPRGGSECLKSARWARFVRAFALLAALGLFWSSCPPVFAVSELWAFYRSQIPLHAEIVAKLKSLGKFQVVLCPLETVSASFLESHPPALAVAIGDSALQKAVSMPWNVPVIGVLIEKSPKDPRVYLLETRQPHDLKIAILQRLQLDLREIWYPWVSEAFAPDHELNDAVRAAGMSLLPQKLDNPGNLSGALKALSTEHCAGILPPDPRLVNNAIIPSIFQASFHDNRPIVGFSESMVRQGAVFAFTLAPEDLASGLMKYSLDLLESQKSDVPRFRKFAGWKLLLNVTVLKKLGLNVPDDVLEKAAKIF